MALTAAPFNHAAAELGSRVRVKSSSQPAIMNGEEVRGVLAKLAFVCRLVDGTRSERAEPEGQPAISWKPYNGPDRPTAPHHHHQLGL